MADPNGAYKVNVWEEPFDAYEFMASVAYLKVLPRHFHIVKFLEPEFAEVRAVLLQRLLQGPTVKLFFEFVPPPAKLLNIFMHGRLLQDKVGLECLTNMRRKNMLCKPSNVGFCWPW
jgi:hypothetical protein